MGWPYHFLTLSKQEILLRRQTIDRYALIAHLAALAPAVLLALLRLAVRAAGFLPRNGHDDDGGRGRYSHVPGSPTVKARRSSGLGLLAARWRALAWWLGDDVVVRGVRWGQRDEWVLGLVWMAVLLVLCVLETGQDYLHLTKRFGSIALSQLPIQYLLSLKALNPYAYAFASSHEHVNRYHRVLGRVIFALVVAHIVFYNLFFVLSGIWVRRFFAPVVFCGVLAAVALHALMGTALVRVRRLSYRIFFITHLGVALLAPVLLFFHAHSARFYVAESLVVFLVDIAVRKFGMITQTASTVEIVPGTNLVKITAPMPAHKIEEFRSRPGSHVYLSLPPEGRTSQHPVSKSLIFDLLFNPFTVASASQDSQTITLVARRRDGPMTNMLSQVASSSSSSSTTSLPSSSPYSVETNNHNNNEITLAIEGPHGAIGKHFQHLLAWGPSRILLVAGGVGATFALPLYHALRRDLPSSSHAHFVWAIRSAADATWAMTAPNSGASHDDHEKSLLDDDNVHLYLTENIMGNVDASSSIELQDMRGGAASRPRQISSSRRPNFQKIVDDLFRHGADEKVAILVCGPDEMARDVRRRVGPWVFKGREVWWHNESFGW
ncbi:Ferric/cupric reductase transmembrane component 2 [Trichoderma ghanense]|uniref:Ferric/cupric reductase transmembrane component 2 n=1 Tax=Trichoderma ghanense TaxID=65468 RepID=A0ABY2HFI9_9HYPO